MGVNTKISLPPNVRLRDVAMVIAALDGVELKKRTLDAQKGSYAARSEKVWMETVATIPECAYIYWINANNVQRRVMYHFEWESKPGWHGLLPNQSDWWIAAGKRLVNFFGGEVDFNDCDDECCDYQQPIEPDNLNHPTDDKPWHDLQDRLLRIQPLTEEEVHNATLI